MFLRASGSLPKISRAFQQTPNILHTLQQEPPLFDVVVQVLEGDNAIVKYREVMGATNPAEAADGTIRKLYAKSVGENSVHGSDAPETAAEEIPQFFSDEQITG